MTLTTRSYVEPIEPNMVPYIKTEVVMGQYFQVAALGALLYDILITLDKEATYFWKLPRRPVDFVYFANRYSGLIGAVTEIYWNLSTATLPLCNCARWTTDITNWIIIVSIDYILMIRVLALHSQDKTLALFLKTLLLLASTTRLGQIIYSIILEHVTVGGIAAFAFCGIDNVSPWQAGMVDWLIPLVYGMVLMVLALYKAAEYWKISFGFKGFTLVKVLIQDQVLYYTFVIGCSIVAILHFKLFATNNFLSIVLINLAKPSFLCILGSRMLFNLKEAGERGQNEGTSYRVPSRTVSDMEFAEHAVPQRESEVMAEVGGSAEYP